MILDDTDDTCPILRMLDFLPFLQVTSPSESGMAIENPNQSQSPSSSSLQSLNPSALMVNPPAMALATIKPDTRLREAPLTGFKACQDALCTYVPSKR